MLSVRLSGKPTKTRSLICTHLSGQRKRCMQKSELSLLSAGCRYSCVTLIRENYGIGSMLSCSILGYQNKVGLNEHYFCQSQRSVFSETKNTKRACEE